ncbi:MAG: hypothetical protein LLG37_07485 [Spirochaetia bacterium]|nr:hypothetical protein [Spirochaetia bacterium]
MIAKISIAILFAFLVIPFSLSAGSINFDASKFYLWNGFESELGWSTDDWKDNAFVSARQSGDFVSQGSKSLEVPFNFARPGQSGMVQTFDTGDISAMDAVSFDIYNSSELEMNVCLMVKTGPSWQYHESKTVKLQPGWNKGIVFSLTAPDYRSESGGNEKTIQNLNFMRRFGLLFYATGTGDGAIYLDNITIKGKHGIEKFFPQEEPEGLKHILIDDFEEGPLRWTASTGWSCAYTAEKASAEGAGNAMKAVFDLKNPGQNAVFSMEGGWDMSDVYSIKFDVYNPADYSMSMTMALSTGDKWTWQESAGIKLKKGWNKDVTVYFKKMNWKNEKSGWSGSVIPDEISSVKRVSFVFNPPDLGKGYVLMDNVTVVTSDPSKVETMMPVKTGDFAFKIWNSFEKGAVGWEAMSDQSGAVLAEQARNFGGEQARGMEMKFSVKTASDKAMYKYRNRMDFADSTGMKFDMFNPLDFPVKVAVAFQTGDDETWIETKQISIAPGWNKDVFIDFTSASFKSAESNWNFTDNFFTRKDIRTVILQVYPDRPAKGSIFMTDIKLARRNLFGEIGKTFGFTLVNNSHITVEPITYTKWGESCFENGTTGGWQGAQLGGWGAAVAVVSPSRASEGKNSLKLYYKDLPNKFGAEYTAATSMDLSQYDYMVFDVYNPGRQGKYAVAIKMNNTEGTWYETKEYVLYPGWNKNIRIDLTGDDWKTVSSNWQNNITITDRSNVKNIYFIITKLTEGVVYMDNFRWGKKGDFSITDGAVEQDVNFIYTPSDNLEGAATLRAAYYQGQNSALDLTSAHVIVRGLGSELTAFGGENCTVFDDVFTLVDPSTLGANTMGISLKGTLGPWATAYSATGLTLWQYDSWEIGHSYIAGMRLKQYFMGTNYLGTVLMNSRRGYAGDSNLLLGDYEQGSTTCGADMSLFAPAGGLFDVTVKGEVLFNNYDTYKPVYMLMESPPVYTAELLDEAKQRMMIYAQADMHIWDLTLHTAYRYMDRGFDTTFCDQDYKEGDNAKIINLTYILDNAWPFSAMAKWSPEWAGFIHYTKIMAEYDGNDQMSDSYMRNTYTFELKNDPSLALNNYDLVVKINDEGSTYDDAHYSDATIRTVKATLTTKVLFGDRLSLKILARNNNTADLVWDDSAGNYVRNGYNELTAFAEAGIKITKTLKLTGNYKYITSVRETHSNWYAELEEILFGAVSLTASYGEKPFTGYWLDDNNDDTITKFMLTLRGYF